MRNLTPGESPQMRHGWMSKPFAKVDVPKVRFLTPDEVKALINACEPDFCSLVKGALCSGMRFGELTRLTVE